MTAIDWEVLTFSVTLHIQASNSYPSSRLNRPSPSLYKGSGKEQDRPTFLLGHSCTRWNPNCYHREKALEGALRACFVYLPDAAILPPAFNYNFQNKWVKQAHESIAQCMSKAKLNKSFLWNCSALTSWMCLEEMENDSRTTVRVCQGSGHFGLVSTFHPPRNAMDEVLRCHLFLCFFRHS